MILSAVLQFKQCSLKKKLGKLKASTWLELYLPDINLVLLQSELQSLKLGAS